MNHDIPKPLLGPKARNLLRAGVVLGVAVGGTMALIGIGLQANQNVTKPGLYVVLGTMLIAAGFGAMELNVRSLRMKRSSLIEMHSPILGSLGLSIIMGLCFLGSILFFGIAASLLLEWTPR